MKKMILVTLTILFATTTIAQKNLSQLSEAERNKILLKTAKEAIQKYAPDYYKYTAGEYKIISLNAREVSGGELKPCYAIDFTSYNREEEYFYNNCAVSVTIWADNGVVWRVGNGHGEDMVIPKEPLTRGTQVPTLKYKKVAPPKPNPDGRIRFD